MGNKPSTPQDERKRELEARGVLLPPAFGIGKEATLPASALQYVPTPSLLELLKRNSPSHRLFTEHLQSGIWVSSATNTGASVLASSRIHPDKSHQEGLLKACQEFEQGSLEFRAHTVESPLLHGTFNFSRLMQLQGLVDTSGSGWLACQFESTAFVNAMTTTTSLAPQQEYYRNDPFTSQEESSESDPQRSSVTVNSWCNFRGSNSKKSSAPLVIDTASTCAVMRIPGCVIAGQATLPLESLNPQFSYHISCDLNAEGPPLVVTIEKSPESSRMSLSQVFTFDRHHVNLVETRAPKIRNTVAWAVQMEKASSDMSDSASGQGAQLQGGLAWQINRAVGVKLMAKPSGGLEAALLLKRWKQPRVTCSLLFASGGGAARRLVGFQGIGIELETGTSAPLSSLDSSSVYSASEDGRVRLSNEDVPVTKATLPEPNGINQSS